jgi:hypothetical protein
MNINIPLSLKIKGLLILASVCKSVQKCATKYHNVENKETDILLTKWKLN